ncbi:hypothetical protein BLOT_013807 [Blomia tropicalis]|nr:hypothetical protein BLOT_013807 [Blomia tropicalis]
MFHVHYTSATTNGNYSRIINRYLPFIKQQLTTTSINQLTINFYDHQPSFHMFQFHISSSWDGNGNGCQQKKQQQQQLVSSNGDQIESKDGSDSNDEKDSNRRRLINHQISSFDESPEEIQFQETSSSEHHPIVTWTTPAKARGSVRLKGFGTLDQPTFKQLKEATGNA